MRVSKNGNVYRGTIIKKCERCKKKFESLKLKTRFCSISCSNKITHKKQPKFGIIRNCSSCKKILTYKHWRTCLFAEKRNGICLSCAIKNVMKKFDIKDKIRKKLLLSRIKIKTICERCGKKFEQEIKNNECGRKTARKFCSERCSYKRNMTTETRRKIGLGNTKKRIKIKIKCLFCQKEFEQEIKEKSNNNYIKKYCSKKCIYNFIGKNNSGDNNHMRKYESSRRNHRIKLLEKIKINLGKNVQLVPFYNEKICKLFDELNKNLGLKIKHAENGGEYHIKELGYFVDGYEPNLNLVIENYEKYHKCPKQIEKDEKRKQEIINYLDCTFIELKEWENKQWYHHLEHQINLLRN